MTYQRVVIKLSGEALSVPDGTGIDPVKAEFIAHKVKQVVDLDVQVLIVIGGGNLWRGADGVAQGMDHTLSNSIGITGTVLNALALCDTLERAHVPARVQMAISVQAAEPHVISRTIRHLEKGRVVVVGGGLGTAFFTTDTAAALRAIEINADVLIKATKVNGVYSDDPHKNPDATRFARLNYDQVLEGRFKVMDMTAFTLCQENNMPIMVVNFWDGDDLLQAVQGNMDVGTLIDAQGTLL